MKPLLRGKDIDEITDILSAEYARRDIDFSPVEVGITAQALHLQQQPFGRTRSTLKGLRLLKASVTDIVRTAKNPTTEEPPQWLQPPDRATYPMPHGRNSYIAVTADPDGHRWIARAWADTHDRVGPFGLVDVWLTTDSETADIIAHIGGQRVGVIPASHADVYRQTLRAAAVFDEDPVTRGRLSQLQPPRPVLLEIRAPSQPENA